MMTSLLVSCCDSWAWKKAEVWYPAKCPRAVCLYDRNTGILLGSLNSYLMARAGLLASPGQSLAERKKKTMPGLEEFVLWGWGRGLASLVNPFGFCDRKEAGRIGNYPIDRLC